MSVTLSTETTSQIITKRVLCDYDLSKQTLMKLRKVIVINELEILKLTGKSIIFENQEIIAYNVVSSFKNRKIINIMVVSKTQSGKTGSMCATIKQYLEDKGNLIPIENIYIITGLSSCEWKEQTKERMPESIQKRVFHRCELPKTFVNEIKNKKNILIIMDEIQVAAKKGQTIYKTFNRAGLLNKQNLYENDVKILEYTATPDGTIYDLMKWKDASFKILAEPGEGYTSSYDLLKMGRVKQYKDLCGYDKETGEVDEEVFENFEEIKNDIDKYVNPLYHIIRTKNGEEQDITIQNFKRIFNIQRCSFIKYDRESEIEDINKTLMIKPKSHIFIFIKEMLRCSKTLQKEFIGVLYDRYSKNPDDATIVQGLVGRDTGYDNNGFSISYTNKSSIERYEKLWESGFEDKTIRWNSKTTKYTNGVLCGKNTFNDPKDYGGFSDESDEVKPLKINKFKTQQKAKEYYNKNLKNNIINKSNGKTKRGPNTRKPNSDGYYTAQIKKQTKVWSWAEIDSGVYRGAANNDYWFYPCYEDISNKTTLEWWLIHH